MDTEYFMALVVMITVIPLLTLLIKDNKMLAAFFWIGLPTEMVIATALVSGAYFTAWYEYAAVFLLTIVFSIFLLLFIKFLENIPKILIKIKLSRYSETELKNAISTDNWVDLPYILRELMKRRKTLEDYRYLVDKIASSDNELIKNYAERCIEVFFSKN